VIIGWALMAGMAYLIMVTQRTVPKLWNPYDILGISEVSFATAISFSSDIADTTTAVSQ
jgi:preprotein translocase subunit Sec63